MSNEEMTDELERLRSALRGAEEQRDAARLLLDGTVRSLRAVETERDAALARVRVLTAERDEARATNTRLQRRCQSAEAIAGQKIEQLRNEGQRNFGRALANYAAARFERERDAERARAEALRGALEGLTDDAEALWDCYATKWNARAKGSEYPLRAVLFDRLKDAARQARALAAGKTTTTEDKTHG